MILQPLVTLKSHYVEDGDIHSEIYQGNDSKQTFYQEIMKLQTALGGVSHDI